MSASTVNVSSSISVVSISAIENAVHIVFGDRPKALEDNTQGDHSVAYALYQEWLINAIKESIDKYKEAGGASNPAWVIALTEKMQEKLLEEQDLLANLGLADSSVQLTLDFGFNKFLQQAAGLQNAYTKDEKIEILSAHKNRVNSDTEIPQDFVSRYSSLEEYKQKQREFFDKLIAQRKIELGARVAESAAGAFLQIKNVSLMTSFKQVPNRAVDTGQGGRINGALNALSKYRSGELSSIASDKQEEVVQTQPVARAEGKRKINQPQLFGNVVTGNDPRYNQDAGKNQDIANKLAGHIITLLDFKKLSDTELNQVRAQMKDNKKLLSSRFRTNDKNVLHFTIASLLTTTFQTFPEIEQDETIKKLTVQAVVVGLLSQEYAGKNNAKWDSNDISSDDVNKILALLEPSDSNNLFGAIATKQSHDANALEAPPSSDEDEAGWQQVNRRKPRKALPLTLKSNSPTETSQPALSQMAPRNSFAGMLKAQNNPPSGPVIFSRKTPSTPSSNSQPKSPPFTPPQPPKGGGPGFGGGKT